MPTVGAVGWAVHFPCLGRKLRLLGVPWLVRGHTPPCTAEPSPEVMVVRAVLNVQVTGPWRSEPEGPRGVPYFCDPPMDVRGAQASREEGGLSGAFPAGDAGE